MIYDGPVRMFDNRFVNFKVDITPGLTGRGQDLLSDYSKKFRPHDHELHLRGRRGPGLVHEQPEHVSGQHGRQGLQLHQRRSAASDLHRRWSTTATSGTGTRTPPSSTSTARCRASCVVDKTGRPAANAYPISLNNLPFNHAFNSVDECLAEGGQNKEFEGRPTALMSPGSLGSRRIRGDVPGREPGRPPRPGAACSPRTRGTSSGPTGGALGDGAPGPGRPGHMGAEGDSGYGYTVSGGTGHPEGVTVTPGDVVKPDIGPRRTFPENTFYVRMGICYTSEDKSRNAGHPTSRDQFTVRAGTGRTAGAASPISRTDAQPVLESARQPVQQRVLLRPQQR